MKRKQNRTTRPRKEKTKDLLPRKKAQKGKKKPATDEIKITAQSGASLQKPEDLVGFRRTKKEDILIVLKKGGKADELKNSLIAIVDGRAGVAC